VTPSGVSRRGGFLGLGAETVGAYTPAEAQRRNAASLYGNSFGTPRPGAVTSTPAQPVAAAPARRMPSRDAFDMSTYDADPDPIGAAIRGMMRGGSLNGGRNSGGGGGVGRSGGGGGGRSDRSTSSSGHG
jgi:hypothetical protein